MFSERSKHKLEFAKIEALLKYRGVKVPMRKYLSKIYASQYIIAQCKQQDLDAKTKNYRNPSGDIVRRIKDERSTPNFPVQPDPDRRPHQTCPFVDVEKCEFCFWYHEDSNVCTT